MKKNGFTLIELLAVIALLAVLTVIGAGIMVGSFRDTKDDINEIQRKLIISAAKSYVIDYPDKCETGCTISINTLVSEGYIDELDEYQTNNQVSFSDVVVSYDSNTEKYSYEISSVSTSKDFACTNSIQEYTITADGNYLIDAAGAEGTTGNNYSYTGSNPPGGGKGARLSATFALKKGDILSIAVGCQGSVTQATDEDGTSGAGGGGSFIFKKISSITNSLYEIEKDSNYYQVLLVAAGGGGSTDNSYYGEDALAGTDGIGATWITPTSGINFSTTSTTGSSSNVLGISQYIRYNLVGGYRLGYSGTGDCNGGFGGGGCTDDERSPGGGWSKGTNNGTTSFSSGTNTTGTTGAQSGNGYVKITKTK